jgi:hypothetical protein
MIQIKFLEEEEKRAVHLNLNILIIRQYVFPSVE